MIVFSPPSKTLLALWFCRTNRAKSTKTGSPSFGNLPKSKITEANIFENKACIKVASRLGKVDLLWYFHTRPYPIWVFVSPSPFYGSTSPFGLSSGSKTHRPVFDPEAQSDTCPSGQTRREPVEGWRGGREMTETPQTGASALWEVKAQKDSYGCFRIGQSYAYASIRTHSYEPQDAFALHPWTQTLTHVRLDF